MISCRPSCQVRIRQNRNAYLPCRFWQDRPQVLDLRRIDLCRLQPGRFQSYIQPNSHRSNNFEVYYQFEYNSQSSFLRSYLLLDPYMSYLPGQVFTNTNSLHCYDLESAHYITC